MTKPNVYSTGKIEGVTITEDMKAKDLVDQMRNCGFQATNVGKAVEIIKEMKKENAIVFLTFTSNMVSSGLRELFAQLIKKNFVDVIITGIGSIEEDLIKSEMPFLLGDFGLDDTELHKKGINRIGNILVPNDRYEFLEKKSQRFLEKIYERQKRTGKLISPKELIFELGKEVKDENSILYWATKNNVPIFCPAITDGAFGLQIYFFKQDHDDFGVDTTGDMKDLASIVLNAEKTGGIILGGGFAKHHAIGVNILREGFDYAVYVTTATPNDGSLSGARTNEAISWSKIKEKGNTVCVEGDVTLVFPLIMSAIL